MLTIEKTYHSIEENAQQPFSEDRFFSGSTLPREIGEMDIFGEHPPRINVDTVLDFTDSIPSGFECLFPFVDFCKEYYYSIGGKKNKCSVVVKNMPLGDFGNSFWHMDCNSPLKEVFQFFVWASYKGTVYVDKNDFDIEHGRIVDAINKVANHPNIGTLMKTLKEKTIYLMDSYIIHKAPVDLDDENNRTFVCVIFHDNDL